MKIISNPSLELIKKQFLGHVTPQKKPVIYATCGIPGAGKSTFVDQQIASEQWPKNAYILNPDRIMLALPEYQDDAQTFGAQQAYENWELPARELAYTLADNALQSRYHVIKDMGCSNPLSMDFISDAKKHDYFIDMIYIFCKTSEAFKRINERDFKISKQAVMDRLTLLENMLLKYKNLADRFTIVDNSDLSKPFQENHNIAA